jgi:hypothetical protein
MEDLRNLMACIDEISSQIPDGMYLKMADQMKRVHEHMNGNKSIHDDTFYYSDDDSELDSDDDSDSDYEVRLPVNAGEAHREVEIVRSHILDYVRNMHQTWKELEKWENELKKERARARPLITRMTMGRKKLAIQRWCEKNASWAPGGEAGELVGCGPIVTGANFWTWKNLVENGLRVIVLEIGTDEEKFADFVCYDELSLETLQKLPAFEKKIYDDYKEECNRLRSIDETFIENASANVRKHEELMQKWEMAVREQENKLRELDAPVFARDNWDAENHNFWTNDEGQMVSNGWEARVELRR